MGAPNQTGCDVNLEDFCQSTVHVRIEWRGISTEYTDDAKQITCKCKSSNWKGLFRLTTDVKMMKWSFDVDSKHNDAHGGREAPVYVSRRAGKFVGAEKPVFEVMGQVIQASMRELVQWTQIIAILRYRRRKILGHGTLDPRWPVVQQCKSEP